MRRIVLLLVVVLGLAPGTWLRSPLPIRSSDNRQVLTFTAIPPVQRRLGETEVLGVWQLASPNGHFGSYSALQRLEDGTLLAVSDTGRLLRFAPPGRPARRPLLDFWVEPGKGRLPAPDVEALARDPVTGTTWAAYERRNTIERHDAAFRLTGRVAPAAMRGWARNSGAEAMVRLAGGRFIVLAEKSPAWLPENPPGLLFPTDPVQGAEPVEFTFAPPAGYRPVDMALLPDGRIMILLRTVRFGIPPVFSAKLMVADPAAIRPGKAWTGRVIADIAAPAPTDNYEGLAVESTGGSNVVLWLISDDNDVPYQRTLLLKLGWSANEKARGTSRAPS